MDKKAQGSIEYLLLIMGVVLIAVLVIALLLSSAQETGTIVTEQQEGQTKCTAATTLGFNACTSAVLSPPSQKLACCAPLTAVGTRAVDSATFARCSLGSIVENVSQCPSGPPAAQCNPATDCGPNTLCNSDGWCDCLDNYYNCDTSWSNGCESIDARCGFGATCVSGAILPGCTFSLGGGKTCPGKQVCQADGTWGACERNPTTEICNRIDDDCDGIPDTGETWPAETCNGRDDDCDGSTDEGNLCLSGQYCDSSVTRTCQPRPVGNPCLGVWCGSNATCNNGVCVCNNDWGDCSDGGPGDFEGNGCDYYESGSGTPSCPQTCVDVVCGPKATCVASIDPSVPGTCECVPNWADCTDGGPGPIPPEADTTDGCDYYQSGVPEPECP